MKWNIVAHVLILLALTGCSAPASPASTKTEAAKPKATYSTVAELKKAFENAGGDCSAWEQTDAVKVAAQSGDCTRQTVLSVYVSATSRDQVVTFAKTSGVAAHLLVGENWIINTPNPEEYVKKLGGTVVTSK